MIPYILLIAIPALFSFVAVDRAHTFPRLRIGYKRDPLIRYHNLTLPIFFAVLILMLCLRHETVGRDLPAYKMYFEIYPQQELQYFDLFRMESLYRLLNWAVGQVTSNYQIWLSIIALMSVIPIAIVYCDERRFGYMQIVIFVSMSTFVILFSALRQCLAIALGMLAYICLKKKKTLLFVICVILAMGFHHSAFMIACLYPLYHFPVKKKHLGFVAPIILFALLFNGQIFRSVVSLLSSMVGEEYELAIQPTGAYTVLILFAAFAVFSFFVADESKMDKETMAFRNFLLMALLLQCFAPVHPLAMRLNYYFIIFIPITMAKCMAIPKQGMERLAQWAAVIISVYFTYDFLSKTYESCVTGISVLNTVPYVPFWG